MQDDLKKKKEKTYYRARKMCFWFTMRCLGLYGQGKRGQGPNLMSLKSTCQKEHTFQMQKKTILPNTYHTQYKYYLPNQQD